LNAYFFPAIHWDGSIALLSSLVSKNSPKRFGPRKLQWSCGAIKSRNKFRQMNPRARRYKRRRGWLITDSTSLVPVCSHWLAPSLFCFPRRNTVVSACIQRCPCNFIPHVQLHSARQNSRQSRWCNKRDPVRFKYDGPRPLWTSFHLVFFLFFSL